MVDLGRRRSHAATARMGSTPVAFARGVRSGRDGWVWGSRSAISGSVSVVDRGHGGPCVVWGLRWVRPSCLKMGRTGRGVDGGMVPAWRFTDHLGGGGVNFTGWGGPPVKGHGALMRPHPMRRYGIVGRGRVGSALQPCNVTGRGWGVVLARVDVHAGDGSATTTPAVLTPSPVMSGM